MLFILFQLIIMTVFFVHVTNLFSHRFTISRIYSRGQNSEGFIRFIKKTHKKMSESKISFKTTLLTPGDSKYAVRILCPWSNICSVTDVSLFHVLNIFLLNLWNVNYSPFSEYW